MIKHPLLKPLLIGLTFYLIPASQLFAEEVYDVKTNGPEKPIIWNKPTKAVFVHSIHTVDAGMECSSCHDDIFFMQRGVASKSGKFTMKAMANGEYCGACHDGDTAFATNTNCIACHIVSEEPLMWVKPTKTSFSHTAHIEDFGLECTSCHIEIFSMKKGAAALANDFSMTSFKEGKYCGTCHNGDDAFDSSTQCESCHYPPAEIIVFTKPVKSVAFDHNIHVTRAELSCESCHKEVFTMKGGNIEGEKLIFSDDPAEKRKYLESLHNKFCGTCHDSSNAFGYMTRCTVCHIGVKGFVLINKADSAKEPHGKTE